MKLTKIETKAFKTIHEQISTIVNECSDIESMNEFFDEDIENRIDEIDEMILLLNNEKELLNDLLDEDIKKNNDDIMNDEITEAANKLYELVLKYENNNSNDLSLRTAVLKYLTFYFE
jgi:hypothetical protein